MMHRQKLLSSVLLAALTFSVHSQAQTQTLNVDAIVSCANLRQDDARLQCFDRLVENLSKQSSNQTELSASAEKQPAEAALPENIGGSQFDQASVEPTSSYRGRVTECRKAGDGKHLFIFDNGQVWKQVKGSKKRFRNCDFAVTVSEDIFGFKMQIDGRRNKIRINRKR